jgi:hypothetical protein
MKRITITFNRESNKWQVWRYDKVLAQYSNRIMAEYKKNFEENKAR